MNFPSIVTRRFKLDDNPSLGFKWTSSDNKAMNQACREAQEFMKKYGKGKRAQMLDFSRYITNRKAYICNDTNPLRSDKTPSNT